MDWICNKLSILIEEGKQALEREGGFSDEGCKEDEVDGKLGGWVDAEEQQQQQRGERKGQRQGGSVSANVGMGMELGLNAAAAAGASPAFGGAGGGAGSDGVGARPRYGSVRYQPQL